MNAERPPLPDDALNYRLVERACRYGHGPLFAHLPNTGDDGYCVTTYRRIAGSDDSVHAGRSLMALHAWRCEVCGYMEFSHALEE